MKIQDIQAVETSPVVHRRSGYLTEYPEAVNLRRTAELREARQGAGQQERLAVLGEHAAMIVHELRSPLSTVAMALEYVAREDISDPALKRLEIARREEKRLEVLVNEILLYTRTQARLMEVFNVGDLLRGVIDNAGKCSAGQDCTIEYDDTQDPVFVCGDRDKLHQAFTNLLSNACEAVSSCQTVRVSLDVDEPAGTVRVVVRNDGYLPPQVLKRLTEPFYTTRPGGTGLGLCIVQRIVEAHNGRLEIRSDPDEGICVTIGLDMARQKQVVHG